MAIALVQKIFHQVTSSTPSVTGLAAVGAGNLIVVTFGGSSTQTVRSITDNGGTPNTYSQVSGCYGVDSGGRWVDVWYAKNTLSGATSITATISGTAKQNMQVYEVSGADTSTPVDVTGVHGGSTSGTVDTGPSIVTSSANDFLVAALRTSGNGLGAEHDATFTLDTSNSSGAWSHAIVSSAGTYTPSWTDTSAVTIMACVAAFKAASGTTVFKALAATAAAFSGSITKNTLAILSAVFAAFNGSIVKKTLVVISAIAAAFNGALAEIVVFIKALTATMASFNGSLIKKSLIVLSAISATFNGLIVKKTLAIVSAISAAFNGSIVKKTLASLAAVASALNGSISRKTQAVLSAINAAFNGSAVKKSLIALSARASAFNGSITRKVQIILAAVSAAFNATVSETIVFVKALVATMASLNASVVKKIFVSLAASVVSLFGSQVRLISFNIAASSMAFSGVLNKFTRKILNAVLSVWNAVVSAVKQTAPPPPASFTPIVVGKILRSFGASFSNPAIIATTSNILQLFQIGGSSFLIAPADTNLFKRTYHIVAGGNIIVPSSGLNPAANLVLMLQGFSQQTRVSLGVQNDVMATLPVPQPLPIGTTAWYLVCKLSGTTTGKGSLASNEKIGGYATVDYAIRMNGVTVSEGTINSSNNPFVVSSLQFKLGVQFQGSVSGSDKFQANLYQFETQQ